jgi:ArsR family transcriptional regulator
MSARDGRLARLEMIDAACKALADPTRLRILGLLMGGEVCVCDIHETLGIPQPKASRHLSYLKRSGLVSGQKHGLRVHYQIAAQDDAVMRALMGTVTHCLGHMDVVGRDRQRLNAKTGCCGPARSPRPAFDCCRPPRLAAADRRLSAERRRAPRMPR